MDLLAQVNIAESAEMRSRAILKAAVLGAAVMLQHSETVTMPSDNDLTDIGFGLEYALDDYEKSFIAYEKAMQQHYEAKINLLSNQTREKP